MLPGKYVIAGVAIVGLAIGAGVIYAIWRQQLAVISDAAHSKAMSDIVTGAAQAAQAADEKLAQARDPAAAEKALADGSL